MKTVVRLSLAGLFGAMAMFANISNVDIVQSGGLVTMTLDPVGAILYGNPGDTVGWGFTLTTDGEYGVSVVSSDFCAGSAPYPSPCTANLYNDFIGNVQGAYDNPGDPPQSQNFDPIAQTGFGSFVVQGSPVVANLVLTYFLTDSNFNQVTGNEIATVSAEVDPFPQSNASAPEPGLPCLWD